MVVFPNFWPLEVISQHFGRQNRIQHPKIPLWTRSEVCRSVSYVKNVENVFLMFSEIFQIQFFHVTPSNFARLIVKTASPGPIVWVPTLGSWKYDDLIWKIPNY